MTWTSTAYTATENAARTAGRPWLMATHIAERAAVIWTSDTGAADDADESAAASPARYAVDRRGSWTSAPTGTATTWYLVIGPLLYAPPLITAAADTIVLVDHNLSGASVVVEGATALDFGTGYQELHSFTVTQTGRWVDHFAARWQADAGDYLRLAITAAEAFTPSIGEVWIGRRRQLRGGITIGRDPFGVSSGLAVGGEGASFGTARDRGIGRQEFPARIRLLETGASLSDETTIRNWWSETDGGARAFVFHPSPTSTATTQHRARLMYTSDGLTLPRYEWHGDRIIEQTWAELPPYRATEE